MMDRVGDRGRKGADFRPGAEGCAGGRGQAGGGVPEAGGGDRGDEVRAQERVQAGDRGGRDAGTHPAGGDPQQRLRTTGETAEDGEDAAPTGWRRI